MLSRLSSDYKDYQEILDYEFHNINFRYRQGLNKTDVAVNTLEYANDFGFMSAEVKVANSYSRNYTPGLPQFDFSQTGGIPGSTVVNARPEELISAINYRGAVEDISEQRQSVQRRVQTERPGVQG